MLEICDLPVWNPLYLLRSTHRCPVCERNAPVVALVAARYDDCLEDPGEAEQGLRPLGWLTPVLLAPVVRLPPTVVHAVRELAPQYIRIRSATGIECYVNHCGCGHALPDTDLHGPGGAFDVQTPEEVQARGIDLHVIPLEYARA
jgi:hypothetical protein